MHNVKRVHQSKAALEAKRLKEQSKIREYLALTEDVLGRKKKSDWSREALSLTTQLLQINPEFYTVWNYRRNILLNGLFPACSPEEVNNLLLDDLSITTAALKIHPKVYWIWNHRRWCLANVPVGPGSDIEGDPAGWKKSNWNKELFVVEKMLDVDPRNFHAWSYRRYVLANMPVQRPESSELAYTTRKIESNFSNFSAWHQRSKILSLLWGKEQLDETKSKEEEFDLVRNAMYTDPDDQSVWIYHRWLMGPGDNKGILEREIAVIQELLDEQPDSKWCMESLVYYKRLLLRKHPTTSETPKVLQECLLLLKELRKVDPSRRRRYDDIELELGQ